MSIAVLLSADTATFKGIDVTKDASGAPQRNRPPEYTRVPVRVKSLGSMTLKQLGQSLIECTHEVYTQQSGVKNGWLITTSDNRTLQVTGVRQITRMGGIGTYYTISCKEVRTT